MSIPITFHIYFGDRYLRSETLTQDVIKIGRLDSSHLRVGAKTAPGMFSVIEVSRDEVHIIDLGSVSGTIVNGQKISRARLKSDDRLQFDNITVIVELPEPAVTYEMVAARVKQRRPIVKGRWPGGTRFRLRPGDFVRVCAGMRIHAGRAGR